MTANDFRRLALAQPEAIEKAHMDHPDFRVRGKIFATLGHPEKGWGMLKLTPSSNITSQKAEPEALLPVKGAWGRRGATSVNLKAANKRTLVKAMRSAWRNTAPKRLTEQFPEDH